MLNTEERLDARFFVGYEVEHTICHGMKTLFVVGIQSTDEIIALAKEHDCNHIYFGTSQSFVPAEFEDWGRWDSMITALLKKQFWVSLDFGVEHADVIHEYSWNEYNRFVAMISVKLPNISLYNYNATLKLDVPTWGVSNPGVWTHKLTSLLDENKYTHWDQYTQDTEIK